MEGLLLWWRSALLVGQVLQLACHGVHLEGTDVIIVVLLEPLSPVALLIAGALLEVLLPWLALSWALPGPSPLRTSDLASRDMVLYELLVRKSDVGCLAGLLGRRFLQLVVTDGARPAGCQSFVDLLPELLDLLLNVLSWDSRVAHGLAQEGVVRLEVGDQLKGCRLVLLHRALLESLLLADDRADLRLRFHLWWEASSISDRNALRDEHLVLCSLL